MVNHVAPEAISLTPDQFDRTARGQGLAVVADQNPVGAQQGKIVVDETEAVAGGHPARQGEEPGQGLLDAVFPREVAYGLTPAGKALVPVLDRLEAWAGDFDHRGRGPK